MDVAAQLEALRSTLTLVLSRLDTVEARLPQEMPQMPSRMPQEMPQETPQMPSQMSPQMPSQMSSQMPQETPQMPEGNNMSGAMPPHDRTERSDRFPKMVSNSKEKLSAIPELTAPEMWPRFENQLMLIFDPIYPWVADWMHRVQQLTDRPTRVSLHRIAQGLRIDLDQNELYEQFTVDIWAVLTLKVTGEARSIISLIHTEMKSADERSVRGPAAYHELHREH